AGAPADKSLKERPPCRDPPMRKRRRARNPWKRLGRCFGRCLLGVLTGCRTPALPFTADPAAPVPPRAVVLARQVAADTAVETARRPLRTGWSLLSEAGDHLMALSQGELGKRVLMPLMAAPPPLPPCAPRCDPAALEAEFEHAACGPLLPPQVHLHVDGAEALEALERLLDQATPRIDVLMFFWEDDPLGQEVAARLLARAGPHLRVRVLIDGGGNLIFGEPKGASAAEV